MDSVSKHIGTIKFPLAVFFLLVVGLLGYAMWAHQHLPDRIAVHFDGSGAPDRWSGKWEITGVMSGVAILYTFVFGVFAIYLPKMPTKMWNLPRKEYWLAPERAARTRTVFCREYLFMGILMMCLLLYVLWDVFQANTVRPDNSLSMNIWFFLGVIGMIIFTVVRMAIKFRRVPSES